MTMNYGYKMTRLSDLQEKQIREPISFVAPWINFVHDMTDIKKLEKREKQKKRK